MMNQPLISVVLGSYNRKSLLKSTLDQVRKEVLSIPHEIIVVDGGSSDGAVKWLTDQKDVITIIQHNHGSWNKQPVPRKPWGYFMNLGFKCAQGKYILMISDDCFLNPGSVMHGFTYFEELLQSGRNIGAVAFYWRNWPEQKNYWVGLTFGGKMFVNHGLYLRSALEDVGWIDEEHYQFYHADGDLCLKLWQKGYEVVDCSQAFVEHFLHFATSIRKSNLIRQQTDWQTYLDRWKGIFYFPDQPKSDDWIFMSPPDSITKTPPFPKKWIFYIKLRMLYQSGKKKLAPLKNRFYSVK